MSYLVDTNVLLRSVQKSHPMQLDASRAIDHLLVHDKAIAVILQNLIEFWTVATRPTNLECSLPSDHQGDIAYDFTNERSRSVETTLVSLGQSDSSDKYFDSVLELVLL